MMPYPIFTPYNSRVGDDLSNYIYPHWVEIFMGIAVFALLIGLIGFLINVLLAVVAEFDVVDSIFMKISVGLVIIGAVLLIVGLIFA